MIDPDLLAALAYLLPAWLIAAMTPGPSTFAVMNVATAQGARAGRMAALGTVAGTALWACAGFFGLKVLFAALPVAATAIKLGGALYLIWVGVQFWRAGGAGHAGQAPVRGTGGAFRFGLVTNLANPKTAAFAASLFAVALPHTAPSSWAAVAIALICVVSVGWYSVLAVVGSTGWAMRTYASWQRFLLRLAGGLFVLFGIRLFLQSDTIESNAVTRLSPARP